jgi:type II secretory pathway pseudopilin PulG
MHTNIKKQPTSSARCYGASKGFTLIETLIAIFILTLTVGGLLTLAANGYFSVRYARNQIVANDLVQESLEFIRNSRDTSAQQNETWAQWVSQFSKNDCFTANGCIVDPYASSPLQVVRPADGSMIAFYPDTGFYGYATSAYPASLNSQGATAPYLTTYVRTITMQQAADPNQLTITATVQWLNGVSKEQTAQSILITNWHGQ